MLKILKFKGKDKDFFFAGCLHHHHNPDWLIPLWEMRGFDSIEEHDSHQIKHWNSVCDENSTVFLLGDTIFGDSDGSKLRRFLNQLNFSSVYLMAGNHFSGWLALYKEEIIKQFPDSVKDNQLQFEVYPLCSDNGNGKKIYFMPNYFEMSINGQLCCLCHYALRSWNKMSHFSFQIHSHEHLANLDSDLLEVNKGKIVDLGYETLLKYNNGSPISFEKLRKYMNKKQYLVKGHH